MQTILTNVTLGHGQETVINREEKRITVILVATTVTFIVLVLPPAICRCIVLYPHFGNIDRYGFYSW